MKSPICYLISGPNGAGKTTFAMEFLPHSANCRNFINADMIAHGLVPLDAESAAMQAGRLFLEQIDMQIAAQADFAFETTLSGTAHIRLVRNMRDQGYLVRLYYLWLPTVELALRRIAERVRRGGHDIPEHIARRRYKKGLANLF